MCLIRKTQRYTISIKRARFLHRQNETFSPPIIPRAGVITSAGYIIDNRGLPWKRIKVEHSDLTKNHQLCTYSNSILHILMSYSLRVISYNCRNLKSSIDNVRQQCDARDIIFLQETWLTNDEWSLLKCLQADFYGDGVSAMDTTSGILIGRPFGGIGILWRKSIGACIQVHTYNNRVMGIAFDNGSRKLLAVNVYMPYDNMSRNSEYYDEFVGYLGMVHSIIQESDVSRVYLIEDWNAEINANSVFFLDQSCLVSVRSIVMSFLILNIWVLIAVVLLSTVKRMDVHHGLITALRMYGSGSCQYFCNKCYL